MSYPGQLPDYLQKYLSKLLIDAAHRCFYEALNLEDTSKDRTSASAAIKRYKNYFDEELREAKQRLRAPGRGGKAALYDLSPLPDYYDRYYPVWKKASKLYNSPSLEAIPIEKRRATVKMAFPDLPDDLIKRFNHRDEYWRTPSYIAAEHAARLCGLPKNRDESSYSPRYLLTKISKIKASR